MHRILTVLAVLALSLAPAGAARAQIGGPNAPTPLTQPDPPPPVKTDLDDEGLTSWQQALIFVAAGLVLAGIAFVIVRDARRAAPVDRRSGKGGGGRAGGGSAAGAKARGGAPAAAVDNSAGAVRARERQQAKRAKAKAKAVREQRKRNRPR
jgi:hypothetical protein